MSKMKKLHWQSRRGMKELDILFEHYLYQYYEAADAEHQAAFEALAEMQDPVITDYLFGRSTPQDAAIADIIAIMLNFSQNHQVVRGQ